MQLRRDMETTIEDVVMRVVTNSVTAVSITTNRVVADVCGALPSTLRATGFRAQSATMEGPRKQMTGAFRPGWCPPPASVGATSRTAADPCKVWVGGVVGESLRDSIMEQLTGHVVDRLPVAWRTAIEVHTRNFSIGSTVCCPSADVTRELLRLCDAAPLVFVDEAGSRHPLRPRRGRTSQQSVWAAVSSAPCMGLPTPT